MMLLSCNLCHSFLCKGTILFWFRCHRMFLDTSPARDLSCYNDSPEIAYVNCSTFYRPMDLIYVMHVSSYCPISAGNYSIEND
jgi:hypothetical protein